MTTSACVREETGYTLTDYKFRGIDTRFIYGSGEKDGQYAILRRLDLKGTIPLR